MERIAILAGGGQLPIAIAKSVTARGGQVHIVAIGEGADPAIQEFPHTFVGWGRISGLISALRRNGDAIVIAGAVRRPDLGRIKPDFGFVRYLPDILSMLKGGDDAILTRVVRFFEAQGFTVKGVADVAPELMAPNRLIAGPALTPATQTDIELGLTALGAVGHLDIGQAMVVANGRILAIEGAEGTDRMLQRLRRTDTAATAQHAGALIKAPKRGQELRIDLPTIGAQTIEHAAAAGLAAIAVHAGKSLILDGERLGAIADAARMSVVGVNAPDEEARTPSAPVNQNARWQGAALGRVLPTEADQADAAKAADTCESFARFGAGNAAAVVRQHVLAVAADEGHAEMAERLATLRQWGGLARRKRAGAIALRFGAGTAFGGADDLARIIDAASASALAGLAIIRTLPAAQDANGMTAAMIAHADAKGLFIIDIARKSSNA